MKKLQAMILSMALVLGMAAPLLAAGTARAEGKETTVHVHKILMDKDKMAAHDENKEYDPTTGVGDLATFFDDKTAKEIAGVYFLAVKDGDTSNVVVGGAVDTSKIDEYLKTAQTGDLKLGGVTEANGLALKLGEGTWKIYEVKEKSTYVGADKGLVALSKAVPVTLTLPYIYTTGAADEIHVYPKNTSDKPVVDKSVGTEGNKKLSADIGEDITWIITSTIPSDIKDYKQFKLGDTLSNALTFNAGSLSVKVKKDQAEATLAKDVNFTVEEPSAGNNNKLTVDFAGHTDALQAYAGGKVTLTFTTKLNANALMATDMINNAQVTFSHKPDGDGTTVELPEDPTPGDPSDPGDPNNDQPNPNRPRVYTGGKKFVKVEKGNTGKTLSGAEFLVMKDTNKYLVETDGVRSWAEADSIDAAKKLKGIVKLTSGPNGAFEIKGLKYGEKEGSQGNGSSQYSLVEITAPAGYALLTAPVTFTVDKDSYGNTAAAVAAQNVENVKLTIPQTGGIGTVIFTVVGLTLIGAALLAIKKRRSED